MVVVLSGLVHSNLSGLVNSTNSSRNALQRETTEMQILNPPLLAM